MNRGTKNLVAKSSACFGLLLASPLMAQTITAIHIFSSTSPASPYPPNNHDGANPYARLLLVKDTLYGTTANGGDAGYGVVFRVDIGGSGFTNLHSFLNFDGANPYAGLILSTNTLYGTTAWGNLTNGTVFALNTDGTGFTNVVELDGVSEGSNPYAGLVLSGNTLYGTTFHGGPPDSGTVFAVKTDGTSYTNAHSFRNESDGADPYGGLVLSGSTLYGTTAAGPPWPGSSFGYGTVFAVNTNGTGFTNLHIFPPLSETFSGTNNDGATPTADLLLSGNTLYGTTKYGGSSGAGTVFRVNTDGTAFQVIHAFSGSASDGANPCGALLALGHILYGTTTGGGSTGTGGSVFKVNTDGTGFRTVYTFTQPTFYTNNGDFAIYTNAYGAAPQAGLIFFGNTLYGTASVGGSGGSGTLFSISVAPELTISSFGGHAIVTWPTNFTGFNLQSTTDLGPSAVWVTNSSPVVVVDGQNTATTPISGAAQFYRLSQ
jgi:uncharacterized repeat protein (TIGR03803 family)